ncbi:HAMP domain-containing protein [bacterium]|nr:HAMP domain-containing protein [bacterium]
MSTGTPRRRLRNYMIFFFVPLTVVPLIALGVLATYLIKDAFNKQIAQRARPELSAFQRNVEFLQRKMISDANNISKDEELRLGLLSKDSDVMNAFAGSNIYRSHFEKLKVFDVAGRLLQEVNQDVSSKWRTLVEELNKDGDGRGPSNESMASDMFLGGVFEDEKQKQFSKSFRSFLSDEGAWDSNSSDPEERYLEISFFRKVLSKKGQHLGYIQGQSRIDQKKLQLLAKLQGVELTLLDPSLNVISASDVSLENLFRSSRSQWSSSVSRWWNAEFKEEPYSFYFSKVKLLSVGEPTWVSVGISMVGLLSLQRQIFWSITVFVLLVALICCFVVIGVSNRITKPISDMVNAVDDIKAGRWVNPVKGDSSTEIGYLIKRFNDMASSVQVTKRMLENKLQELAQAHSELKQTQNQLVHSAKMSSLGQLVAGVAHELNNPIAFIYSNMTQMKQYMRSLDELDSLLKKDNEIEDSKRVELLKKKLSEIDWDFLKEDMEDIVQSCLEGSVRVKDIVLGLRNFSRSDQSQFIACDLNQCLKETAKLLRGQIKNTAELHWDLCSDSLVHASVSQVNQVFMNLIANAVQAVDKNGNIWISTTDLEDRVKICIRDDGAGISKQSLDKIFDPFYTTKKVGEGTGLGLSIVYGIIQRHRGSIEVKSVTQPRQGHGTEFVITLFRRLEADGDGSEMAS